MVGEGSGPDLRAITGGKSKKQAFPQDGDAAEKAAWYIDQGYVPIPLPPRVKKPGDGWNKRTLESATVSLEKDFANPDANIGIRLGEPSKGLVDVDLDCEEVVKIAGRFLSKSLMSFGRKSAPQSHIIYRSPGAKAAKYFDPRRPEDRDHATVVELRSDGDQTVFPGSVHPSGEEVRFASEGNPAEVKAPEIERKVRVLGAAALLGRYWPAKGRHEAQLALAGGLLEAAWEDKDAELFLRAVCFLAGDEDPDKRKSTVATTRARIEAADPIMSWPKLVEVVGEDIVKTVRKWLNIRDNVVYVSGDLRMMATAAEKAVSKEGGKDVAAKIYVRGNSLVRVERPTEQPNTPVFVKVPDAALQEVAASHMRWLKALQKGEKHVLPPKEVIQALTSRAVWPLLGLAMQITECPILRPDGTVLNQPGLDEATGTLYLPNAEYPLVPDAPTGAERDAARDLLEDAFVDFPFQTPEHKSAALAAALTPVARSAFDGPVPLFLFEAPDGGTGKDLCARTCGIMSTGQQPSSETFTEDVAEMRKRITSHAIEGSRIVLLGNVEGELGGAPLEDALTLEIYSDRILGGNKNWRGPLRTTFYASANNATIGVTMARRICPVRLDAQRERPDRRTKFNRTKRELLTHVKSPEFVVALLILLRAYIAAGRPDMRVSTWGSYEEWSELVIGALKYAGLPDPGVVREELAERADPRAEYTRQFITGFAWFIRIAGKLLTAKEAVDLMDSPGDLLLKDEEARERIDVMRNAAMALLKSESLNAIQLGILLRRNVDKIRDGDRIVAQGSRGKSTLWGAKWKKNIWDEMAEMDLGWGSEV